MKKVIAGILCLLMVAAMLPMSALAAEAVTVELNNEGVPTAESGTGWTYTEGILALSGGYAFTFTGGACSVTVNNLGIIEGGVFNGAVNNTGSTQSTADAGGTINGGTFNGEVTNGHGWNTCTINGGTFNNTVTLNNHGIVYGGTFTGEVVEKLGSKIYDGEFALVLELNGGSWAEGYTAPISYSYTDGLTLPTAEVLSNGSLFFDGWYDNAEFSGLPTTAIAAESTGRKIYYARFADGITNWEAAGNTAVENTDYTVDADGDYTVKTALGLAKIANIVNGGENLSGKTVTLESDIDLLNGGVSGYGADTLTQRNSWIPINGFAGTLDGNGKKIKNLYVLIQDGNAGLFGSNAGTIKDLELASGRVTMSVVAASSSSELHVGSFAATTTGTIENCINRAEVYLNDTARSITVHIGGIVGLVSTSTVGAVVSTVFDCTNYAKVSSLGNSSCGIYGGGIAGYLFSGRITGRSTLIDGCRNEGVIDINPGNNSWAGGIAGSVQSNSNSNTSIIARVLNSANIGAVGGTHAGGITGYNRNASYIYNCYNTGNVTGGTNAGGIVGLNYYSNATVANCYNTGTASGATNNGGIIGNFSNGVVSNGYYLATSAATVAGKVATGKEAVDCAAFSLAEGVPTLAAEVGGTTDLLTALNSWAKSSADYRAWETGESNYPVFAAPLRGDLDGDGAVTTADAVLLMQYLVGYDVTFAADADISEDGRISIFDAVSLLKQLSV